MKLRFSFFLCIVLFGFKIKVLAQVMCAPVPEPGSRIEVNVNSYVSFNLRCVYRKLTHEDSIMATNIHQLATWRINGKEITPGQQTPLGSITFTTDKKLLYKAPFKKPPGRELSLTAEYTHSRNENKKNIYFWTIIVKDEAYTEAHLEDQDGTLRIKTEKEGVDMAKNISTYENYLSADSKAKLQQAKMQHPEVMELGKYKANATAQFIRDGNKHHFVISIYDPKDQGKGAIAFDLPDSLIKAYETDTEDCKAAITYGVNNCKVRASTKGYVNQSSDGKGNNIEGLLRIQLTEVGRPGEYVKEVLEVRLSPIQKIVRKMNMGHMFILLNYGKPSGRSLR